MIDKWKIRLNRDIKKIEQVLADKTSKQLKLDSFIISVSNYSNVKGNFTLDKSGLEKGNVIFQNDLNHIEKHIGTVLS